MAILLDEETTLLVQGITGREGSTRAQLMKEYGTNVVAGVTPGRGGTEVAEVPVYNTVQEAVDRHGTIDASVTFVPGPAVKDAAVEAIDAEIKLIVMPVERVPLHDIVEMVSYAIKEGARIIGPGSLGIISPGKALAGWIGGTAEMARTVFKPGSVGVLSRSGGETTTLCWTLTEAGLGVSTAIHIGAEPIVGLSFAEALLLFEEDEETKAVAMFGEIGTVAEEEAAEVIKEGKFTKPLVAFISGVGMPSGMRFSHASAIIERGRGTAETKIRAFREAGVPVVDNVSKMALILGEVMQKVNA